MKNLYMIIIAVTLIIIGSYIQLMDKGYTLSSFKTKDDQVGKYVEIKIDDNGKILTSTVLTKEQLMIQEKTGCIACHKEFFK